MPRRAYRARVARHRIVLTGPATAGERARAVAQARLPVRLGGLGLTSMVDVTPAACVGSWALCWGPLQRLCPHLFGALDLSAPSTLPAVLCTMSADPKSLLKAVTK